MSRAWRKVAGKISSAFFGSPGCGIFQGQELFEGSGPVSIGVASTARNFHRLFGIGDRSGQIPLMEARGRCHDRNRILLSSVRGRGFGREAARQPSPVPLLDFRRIRFFAVE